MHYQRNLLLPGCLIDFYYHHLRHVKRSFFLPQLSKKKACVILYMTHFGIALKSADSFTAKLHSRVTEIPAEWFVPRSVLLVTLWQEDSEGSHRSPPPATTSPHPCFLRERAFSDTLYYEHSLRARTDPALPGAQSKFQAGSRVVGLGGENNQFILRVWNIYRNKRVGAWHESGIGCTLLEGIWTNVGCARWRRREL